MQPITDFNEVTMHALEIIYTHLFNTKGPLPGKATVTAGAGLGQGMQVSRRAMRGGAGVSRVVRGSTTTRSWHVSRSTAPSSRAGGAGRPGYG